jgi:hypothetical protein
MSDSRLGQVAQLAEIVAAIGVIISLLFVGFEVRKNTAIVNASAVQEITTSSRDVLLNVALDEDFARIRRRGEEDLSQLTEDEAYRFFQFNRQNWLYFQSVWIQVDLGVMDARAWASYERIICRIVELPGNRADWPNHVEAMDPAFRELVESCF